MSHNAKIEKKATDKRSGLLDLLRPYAGVISALILLTLLANGLNLAIPKIISLGIDDYAAGNFQLSRILWEFCLAAVFIFIFTYWQNVLQVLASERVARNLRDQLAAKISRQDHVYIQKTGAAKLLTNLTSDIDAVKIFISLAIPSLVSSVFLILGASVLLIMINWRLALAVLAVLPVIDLAFFMVMSRIRRLFRRSQETIDWLNKVINESILGAALIRLLNSQQPEAAKFLAANTEAKKVSLSILKLFASIIPVITFLTNLATLIILAYGGHLVISGGLSLGNFTAFNNYLALLIFPIIIIGFMSNVIAQSQASYQRAKEVLDAPPVSAGRNWRAVLRGDIAVRGLSLRYGEKAVLKDISFTIAAGSRTAIIGPTAAGKTQLLYILTGLLEPTAGRIEYDGRPLEDYDRQNFHGQVGFVFQDSVIFNLSLRENIAFSRTATDADLAKAIRTAELEDFINSLPERLDTIVSERGTSLSGGQKQRLMLARALAIDPRVLLLDDFTARLDSLTERKILNNIKNNYPGLTLVSVTQKIAPIEDYDQIILLMEGEQLAAGKHQALLASSAEYAQIHDSQASMNQYELRPE